MKPIYQTIFDFENGDCVQACIASIMELQLEDVPNFMGKGPSYFSDELKKWLDQFNLSLFDFAINDPELISKLFKDQYILVAGISPRSFDGTERHSVIYKNGRLVHDPAVRPEDYDKKEPDVYDPKEYSVFAIKDIKKYIKENTFKEV